MHPTDLNLDFDLAADRARDSTGPAGSAGAFYTGNPAEATAALMRQRDQHPSDTYATTNMTTTTATATTTPRLHRPAVPQEHRMPRPPPRPTGASPAIAVHGESASGGAAPVPRDATDSIRRTNTSTSNSLDVDTARPRLNKRTSSDKPTDAALTLQGQTASSRTTASAATGDKAKTETKQQHHKFTRIRKPSSCFNCRTRKKRCNRIAPCDQCERTGEVCDWQGATPVLDRRAEVQESVALRQQVAELEALVRYYSARQESQMGIISQAPSSVDCSTSPSSLLAQNSLDPLKELPYGDLPRPSASTAADSSPAASTAGSNARSVAVPPQDEGALLLDLRANDICEALSHLAIQDIAPAEDAVTGAGPSARTIIDQAHALFIPTQPSPSAQLFRSSMHHHIVPPSRISPQQAYQDVHPSWSANTSRKAPTELDFPSKAPDLNEIIALLPSPQHALSAITYYCGYVSWYMHLVHLPSFEKKWAELTAALSSGEDNAGSTDDALDPFFMATFLGICATGLSMMPAKRAKRDGFGSDKAATVDKWLDAAMLALRCGRFVEAPTLESIRATTVLATFRVFMSTGEAFGTGMALLGLASQAAISIGLHRDPDRTPGRYTLFEAEERRRLFHSLFTLCVLSSSAVARTWTIFDLNMIDVMLPLDANDNEIETEEAANIALEARARSFSETPMTSVIAKMQLAIISKRIGDAAFGIRGVSYRTVLDFDYELSHFELSLPECYQVRIDSYGSLLRSTPHITVVEMRTCMLQMSLGTEYLRLHRPFLLLAASNDDYKRSKMQCVLNAKRLLAIFASPSCSQQPWGGLASKAVAAAVVLAMTCLAFPNDPEIDLFPGLVHRAAAQMERHQAVSLISKKGATVLRFLLAKVATAAAAHVQEPTSNIKRARSANTAFNLHRTNQYSSRFHPVQSYSTSSSDPAPSEAPSTQASTSSRTSAENLIHGALDIDLSTFLGSDIFEFGTSTGESQGVDFSFRCP